MPGSNSPCVCSRARGLEKFAAAAVPLVGCLIGRCLLLLSLEFSLLIFAFDVPWPRRFGWAGASGGSGTMQVVPHYLSLGSRRTSAEDFLSLLQVPRGHGSVNICFLAPTPPGVF